MKRYMTNFKGFNKKTRIIIQIVFVIIIALMICLSAYLKNYSNPQKDTHTILRVDKVESVQGDNNGFTTSVYYMISTDKGAYKIKTNGLNACLECTGLKEGETYILITRGMNIPILGMYPNIVGYEKNN